MTADLSECFFQIAIPPNQQDVFRIIWFENDNIDGNCEVWKFRVHVWGVNSSPFIATFCIKKVAGQNCTNASKITTDAIQKNMYVHDLLKSVDNFEEACIIISEIVSLFCESGFKLTKWTSNSREVMSLLLEEDLSPSIQMLDYSSDAMTGSNGFAVRTGG